MKDGDKKRLRDEMRRREMWVTVALACIGAGVGLLLGLWSQ